MPEPWFATHEGWHEDWLSREWAPFYYGGEHVHHSLGDDAGIDRPFRRGRGLLTGFPPPVEPEDKP